MGRGGKVAAFAVASVQGIVLCQEIHELTGASAVINDEKDEEKTMGSTASASS